MKQVLRNLIYVLKRFKTATFLNVLGLSVAFAAFMIIMMQVDFDYSFNKSIEGHEYIYRVETTRNGKDDTQATLPRPMANLLFQSSPHILAGCIERTYTSDVFFSIEKSGIKDSYKEPARGVIPSYTNVFPFEMIEGSIDVLDNPEYVIIPQSLSRKLFSSESPLGQKLEKEEGIWIVGGVYKDFPSNTSIRNIIYYSIGDENLEKWTNWNYQVFIKVDSPEVISELADNFKKANPDIKEINDNPIQFTPLVETYYAKGILLDTMPKASRETVATLFAIGIVIVIIAGVNFTNFSMALTPARIKNINTQKVFGATSVGLRNILIIEAVFISLIAFLISLLIVLLAAKSPVSELLNATISLSEHVFILLATAVLALVVGLFSGIYPSFYMTSFPTSLVLKGSFGLSPQGRKTRALLIGFQFMASVTLIICAGFMYLQNQYFLNRPYGYDIDVLIVSDLSQKAKMNWDVLKEQLENLPGVEKAEKSFALLASSESYNGWGMDYKNEKISFQCIFVGLDFLDVMGIKVSDGRDFLPSDTINGAFIFNEMARNKYNFELNNELDGSGTIVGFIPNINFATLRTEIEPMGFLVSNRLMNFKCAYIRVQSGNNLHEILDRVKTTFKSFDSEYSFYVRFFDDVLNVTYEKEHRLSSLITLFCLIAIFISIVGVFGLVLFECEYRKKEIGLRKVLGSSIKEILFLFNETYIIILTVCFFIAIPMCYYFMNNWLDNFAYHIPLYWWVFVAGWTILLLIVILTVSWQSRRAAMANPEDSLKSE